MKNRASLGLALAAAATLTAGGSALGAGTKIDLTIKSVSETKAQYKGRIGSDDADCVERRLIKVKSQGRRLVKARSDGDGRFDEIGKRPAPGATLRLKVVGKGDCAELTDTARAE